MVKIVIAGGAGNVAQEIIDVLVATKRHDILLLSRRNVPDTTRDSNISYQKTDYSSVEELEEMLQGVEVVLSFIAPYMDQEEAFIVQKNLIDASVKANVKRFAPSEWASSGFEHLSWYTYKALTRQYLHDLNKDGKKIEYSLFQPGLFTNYLTRPYNSSNHVKAIETFVNFDHRRALFRQAGEEDKLTLTTVKDLANVVSRAIEFSGEWPVVGGMSGSTLSLRQIVELGEEIRGKPFAVDKVPTDAMEDGTWTSSWLPKVDHPSIPPEHVEMASKTVTAGILLAIKDGAFECGNVWNKLLPGYDFESAEAFLKKAWAGKP